MRARLVRMEPGYRGRQRIVIEIAGDFREQFDQLQGALLEVQITRAIPRRSLASNDYFHALVSRIASTVWGEFDEIKSDLVVEYGTPCLERVAWSSLLQYGFLPLVLPLLPASNQILPEVSYMQQPPQ